MNATTAITPIATPTVRNVSESWLLKGSRSGTLNGRGTEPVATEADVLEAQQKVAKWFAEIDEQFPKNSPAASTEAAAPTYTVWDDEFDAPYVAPNEEPSAETLALCTADTTIRNLDEPLALEQPPVWMQAENATEAYPGQCDDCPGRLSPLCCWSTEDKKPATYTYMILPGEHRPFIHEIATEDQPIFGLKAEQAYYLVRSESLTRCAEQPVYHVVVWSYELCRWICPCGDPHRVCRHTRLINQDCRDRAMQANMTAVLTTFRQTMGKNGCCEHEDLVQASGLDSLQVKQAIRFLNDAGEHIVWMRSEFPYWQWHNVTQQEAA